MIYRITKETQNRQSLCRRGKLWTILRSLCCGNQALTQTDLLTKVLLGQEEMSIWNIKELSLTKFSPLLNPKPKAPAFGFFHKKAAGKSNRFKLSLTKNFPANTAPHHEGR